MWNLKNETKQETNHMVECSGEGRSKAKKAEMESVPKQQKIMINIGTKKKNRRSSDTNKTNVVDQIW